MKQNNSTDIIIHLNQYSGIYRGSCSGRLHLYIRVPVIISILSHYFFITGPHIFAVTPIFARLFSNKGIESGSDISALIKRGPVYDALKLWEFKVGELKMVFRAEMAEKGALLMPTLSEVKFTVLVTKPELPYGRILSSKKYLFTTWSYI